MVSDEGAKFSRWTAVSPTIKSLYWCHAEGTEDLKRRRSTYRSFLYKQHMIKLCHWACRWVWISIFQISPLRGLKLRTGLCGNGRQMSINSLKNGFKNTTPRALEACCEHKYSLYSRTACSLPSSSGSNGMQLTQFFWFHLTGMVGLICMRAPDLSFFDLQPRSWLVTVFRVNTHIWKI